MSNEAISELIKESVIKILEILSTADPVVEINVNDEEYQAQYVIDETEVNECKKLLERIDPGNQQLRFNKHKSE